MLIFPERDNFNQLLEKRGLGLGWIIVVGVSRDGIFCPFLHVCAFAPTIRTHGGAIRTQSSGASMGDTYNIAI